MKYQKYICILCGFVYDEEKGSPEQGIAPGTLFRTLSEDDPRAALFSEDEKSRVLPDDWMCPDCAATKDDFEVFV